MTAVACCIVIGFALYCCVYEVCKTLEQILGDTTPTEDFDGIQNELDDQFLKDPAPTFDDVLRSVNDMLGGDVDE